MVSSVDDSDAYFYNHMTNFPTTFLASSAQKTPKTGLRIPPQTGIGESVQPSSGHVSISLWTNTVEKSRLALPVAIWHPCPIMAHGVLFLFGIKKKYFIFFWKFQLCIRFVKSNEITLTFGDCVCIWSTDNFPVSYSLIGIPTQIVCGFIQLTLLA